MSRFFGGIYNLAIHKVRWVAIILFIMVGIGATVIAADIGPLTE
jgi:hypothetical protein